jgi:hypothetical protein
MTQVRPGLLVLEMSFLIENRSLRPGANPIIVSYNAGVVKIYNPNE